MVLSKAPAIPVQPVKLMGDPLKVSKRVKAVQKISLRAVPSMNKSG